MKPYEVAEPIICSPFDEPTCHWHIVEGEEPEKRAGRRRAVYYYRDPHDIPAAGEIGNAGKPVDLTLVNQIRERVKAWRSDGYSGVTRTTLEMLQWWHREREEEGKRQFFAQLEAAETIIFLNEARADYLQGIDVPPDEPSEEQQALGFKPFRRFSTKMATGTGKTTVMALLAAWSILNKVNNPSDGRFSQVVLVVCPNVTIRGRLRELDPQEGDGSIYRTRELVPSHLMPLLTQGRVLVMNWHVFAPHTMQQGGVSARVHKAGVPVTVRETIIIGPKTTTARGSRYLSLADFERQQGAGLLTVKGEQRDAQGNLIKVTIESTRYVESDTALVNRILGREVGGKQNILVFNDEAHHAYRIRRPEPDENESDLFDDEEDAEEFFKEATIWVEGLDRINKKRGINFCVDLSATPYYLGRVGQDTNRPFPWVVSDFSLTDAIESGLVKIPQLAIRDNTGKPIAEYFNLWHSIMQKLTSTERGGKRTNPKSEAILKHASHPITMLAELWEEECKAWAKNPDEKRRPVFIIVCKTTPLARMIYEWLAEDKAPTTIGPSKIEGFRNREGQTNTIRVDCKVAHETDTGQAKSAESSWMRFTLDTVGRRSWPTDRQGRPVYPEGFEELARKMKKKSLHPPGRDVCCIVSVGMLTEGWDCNTVTHIVGLRPFMSQLLCEQVVGRGLRRAHQVLKPDNRFDEEVAKVFGVPFTLIPFKAQKQGEPHPKVKRYHVHAIPSKADYEIRFPRVEGYTQAIRNRITVDWPAVAPILLDPMHIPPEVDVKGMNVNNQGRLSLSGPGRIDHIDLQAFRDKHRVQELTFDLARSLTRDCLAQRRCAVPAHALFPQLATIVQRYLAEKVTVNRPADLKDVFLSPYYGWVIEGLLEAIRPDSSQGEAPEIPRYETSRGPGSTADVDFWTSRDAREVIHSHLNYVVADTARWEQSAAYLIDTHPAVAAFVKNAGLAFAIPYLHNGQMHDYIPDFLIRLKTEPITHLILETKGYDPLKEVKKAAAERWVAAVNAEGSYGQWRYEMVEKISEIRENINQIASKMG